MAGGEAGKKSDLPVRIVSAFAMLAVAGVALWVGGAVWIAFVGAVAAVGLYEWRRIVIAMEPRPIPQMLWIVAGVIYIAFAAAVLLVFRQIGIPHVLLPVLVTVLTDTGAYFTGRTLGGPRIAPAISPSKTWSGLGGGMLAAGIGAAWWLGQFAYQGQWTPARMATGFGVGAVLAIVAQAGDFLESGMKRRAGIKDSGGMIPGHGGVLDRVDGLLAVVLVCGLGWVALGLGAE